MQKKLYVGNLASTVTEDDLVSLFTKYGKVSYAKIVLERKTGESRGFGFVTMNDRIAPFCAEQANGHHLNGCKIDVAVARESVKNKRMGYELKPRRQLIRSF